MEDVKTLEATFLLCRMQHEYAAIELRRLLETGPSDEKVARASHVKAFMQLCDRKGKAMRALEAAAWDLQNALEPKSEHCREVVAATLA